MKKEKIKGVFGIIIIATLVFMLIFMFCFYEYHILPKQAKVLDKVYGEKLIKINDIWIDYYYGRINITDEQIILIEKALERVREESERWE